MTLADAPRRNEVALDFPREWIEFVDPDDSDVLIRADLTWLLSGWSCVFGSGCHGINAGRAEDGCCTHGAFFTDADDVKRVRKAAARLTPETWQHYRKSFKDATQTDELDGEDGEPEPALRTATVDDACVFHNRLGFEGGFGCALHAQALRDGVHPLAYKPDVCWQLPIKRDYEKAHHADGSEKQVVVLTEFDRRSWGTGGHDLHWWCTSAPEAHTSGTPLYESYAAELTELIGQAAYEKLVELCAARRKSGLIAVHPATARNEPNGL